jgi:hypothetical protein
MKYHYLYIYIFIVTFAGIRVGCKHTRNFYIFLCLRM